MEAEALLVTSPPCNQDEVKTLEILLRFRAVPSIVQLVTLYA